MFKYKKQTKKLNLDTYSVILFLKKKIHIHVSYIWLTTVQVSDKVSKIRPFINILQTYIT